MFKIASLSFVLIPFIFCFVATEEIEKEEMISDKYDDLDFQTILENPRLRDQYYNCFMELGPCSTPDKKFFKELLPEVFQTECRRCNDKQKAAIDQIADFYVKRFPDKWEAFIRKFVIEPARLNKN
ncbi:putative odorant-binding protein A10 [Belonocnema kinseyi]|uniref:putative odorant-binding protein A10 n=1 Tax=Belonocnema kinseyi TaxID=2817044 RepID=UPI00143D9FE0|nr:putative odorant-binding protein A10 [Belonocnema kinseyi]